MTREEVFCLRLKRALADLTVTSLVHEFSNQSSTTHATRFFLLQFGDKERNVRKPKSQASVQNADQIPSRQQRGESTIVRVGVVTGKPCRITTSNSPMRAHLWTTTFELRIRRAVVSSTTSVSRSPHNRALVRWLIAHGAAHMCAASRRASHVIGPAAMK
jgi:hypothetical protein